MPNPPLPAFDALLATKAPVRGVGDLRLTYEPSRLVGVRLPPVTSARGPALLSAALAAGVTSIVLALLPAERGASHLPALGLGVLAAMLASAAAWSEQRQRARRGFVLYFATELLRLDRATRIRGSPRTVQLPFDAVREVAIARRPSGHGYQLLIEVREGGRYVWEVLADGIPPEEEEALVRLQAFLERAFGLRPAL